MTERHQNNERTLLPHTLNDPPPSFSIWVVYDHPLDIPDKFVARRHVVEKLSHAETADTLTADSIEGLRKQMPPNLKRFPNAGGDEQTIVEIWI